MLVLTRHSVCPPSIFSGFLGYDYCPNFYVGGSELVAGSVGMNFLWPNKKPESSSPSADRKPVDRRELSPHELFAYANDLELQLEKAEAQRADLLRELESYTGASANLTWDATGLLQQRAIDAEAQLERLRTSFKHLSVSHDSLSDDFAKLKEAKRLSDQSGREVRLQTIQS